MLRDIYGSCKIHRVICGAWHLRMCLGEAPSPGRRPLRPAGLPLEEGVGLSQLAPGLESGQRWDENPI